MKRIIQLFSKIVKSIKKMFEKIGKILPKIFNEKLFIDCCQTIIKTMVISIITAICLLFVNSIFKSYKEIKYTNDIINKICLGESKDYIEQMLGIPRFEFYNENITNSFYSLERVVIRFVFDGEYLVGYFITVKNVNSGIEINDPVVDDKQIKFGECTFEQCGYSDSFGTVIDGCVCMGGVAAINTYYWEYGYMYGYGLYRDYVTGIFPYGFIETDSYDLMCIAYDKTIESEIITKYREELHPNTFGIMDSHYENIIKPYMYNDKDYILWVECMMKLIEDVQ